MKTIRNACELQPNALEISVGDQIEQLAQIIGETDGHEYFQKTFRKEEGRVLKSYFSEVLQQVNIAPLY